MHRIRRLASALLAVAAAAPVARADYAFVACTDFGSGCASWVEGAPPWTAHPCVEPLSSDPVCRWALGRVFVVNRFAADNVQVLDPGNDFATLHQYSVGNGSNPQDIAVISPEKAYVSRLADPDLLIVNPMTGAALGAISLAAWSDPDGSPEPFKMFHYGDRVFVILQRLEDFVPLEDSYVAVIDTRTDVLLDADPVASGVQAIRLSGRNPNTDFAYDAAANRLLVGLTGSFGSLDGGVEGIDPVGLAALGYETTEAQLGGDLNDVALAPNGRAYAVVSDASFNTHLVRYDRASGAHANTVFSPGGFSLGDIEVNSAGELWVCDRTFATPGVRIYDTGTDGLLAGPIGVGLPPFDLCFDEYASVAVGQRPAATGLHLLSAGPNPSRGTFEVRFAAHDDRTLPARLTIFDVRGARVGIVEGSAGAEGRLAWRAERAPGLYYYRLERGGAAITGRFVRLE
jgi:DNA-binding beta-propeller fold protein YncE